MSLHNDVFTKAHADAQKAVATFLPSLTPAPPAAPAQPSRIPPAMMEAARALSKGGHAERMSQRMARGLPPEPLPPPSPQETFGPELDQVHIRALSAAIAAHPEDQRAPLLHEAHQNLVKYIAANNGQIVHDGHMQLAHTPQAAEMLAAKIINEGVDAHDQRKAAEEQAGSQPVSSVPSARKTSQASLSSQGASQPTLPSGESPSGSVIPSRPKASLAAGSSLLSSNNGLPDGPKASLAAVSPLPSPNNTTPEIIPPAGTGQIEDPGPPPPVSPAEAAEVGTNDDGEIVTQPKNSVAANQKLAMDAAPELHDALTAMTAQIPGTSYARIRPQKDEDRLDEKTDESDPNTLSDYLGAQVSADSPQAKDQMLAALRKNFKTIEVDDKFLEGRNDKAGYPSANAQVQLSNGSTGEVQIVPKEVQDITDESHKYYKAGREAELAGNNDERDKQWGEAKKMHAAALDAFKTRNGMKSQDATSNPHDRIRQSLEAAGYKMTGAPISLGGKMFVGIHQPSDSTEVQPNAETESSTPDAAQRDAGAESTEADQQAGDGGATGKPVRPDSVLRGDSTGSAAGNVRPSKGDIVKLKDGSTAEVKYSDPRSPMIRVKIHGGPNRDVSPDEVASNG